MNDPLLERLTRRDTRLAEAARALRSHVSPILRRIVTVFPHYTGHDDEHSETLANICEWLAGTDLLDSLNNGELFVLHSSIFLHDIGMAATPEELADTRGSAAFKSFASEHTQLSEAESLAEWVRRIHHRRSADYVRRCLRDATGLNAVEPALFEATALIVESHGEADLANFDRYDPFFAWGNSGRTLRLPLLGVLLRLSDLLHLNNDRTPLPVVAYVDLSNARSREEWSKHLATFGIAPIPAEHAVRMTCTCTEPSIHRSLLRLCDYVNKEFDYCREILQLVGQRTSEALDLTCGRIDPKIIAEGYEPWLQLQFHFDRNGILRLLEGARLYPNPAAVVKELLMNAVDATRQRFRVTGEMRPVEIRVNTSERTLEVIDSGPGMGRREIEHYLLNLGRSIYHSEEYSQLYRAPQRIESVSEFGIGFASAFGASDHVTLETRNESADAIVLDMYDLVGFAAARRGTMSDVGTHVHVRLRNDPDLLRKVYSEVRHLQQMCPHLDVPIRVTMDGTTNVLVTESYEHEPRSLLADFFKDKASSFQIAYHRFAPDHDDITGVIGIYCTAEGETLAPGGPPWYQLERESNRRISQLGFRLPFSLDGHTTLIGAMNVSSFTYDIDLKGRMRLELDPSRTRLQESAHNRDVLRQLDRHIVEFLLELNRTYWHDLPKDQRLKVYAKLAANWQTRALRTFHFNEGLAPLVDLLMDNVPFRVFGAERAEMTWNEIRALERPVVVYNRWGIKTDNGVEQEAATILTLASECVVVQGSAADENFDNFADVEGLVVCNRLRRSFQIVRPWKGSAAELRTRRSQVSFNRLSWCVPFYSESVYAIVSSTTLRTSSGVSGLLNIRHPKIASMLAAARECAVRQVELPRTNEFLLFFNNGYIGAGRNCDYVDYVAAKHRDCLMELARSCNAFPVDQLVVTADDFVSWERES
jgi:signal transduction histidine kinase